MEPENSFFDCEFNEPNYLFDDASFPFHYSSENSHLISQGIGYSNETSLPQQSAEHESTNFIQTEQTSNQETDAQFSKKQQPFHNLYQSQALTNNNESHPYEHIPQGAEGDKTQQQEQQPASSTFVINKKKSLPKVSPKQTSQSGARLSVKEKALQRKMTVMKRLNIEVNQDENSDEISDKKQQQKIKNRISAQRSRDSKKHQLHDLKEQITRLEKQVDSLVAQNSELIQQLEQNLCVKCKNSIDSCHSSETTNSTISSPVSQHEFTRYSSAQFNGNLFSQSNSMLVVLAVIVCLGVALHGNSPNGIADLSQSTNVMRLHEIGNRDISLLEQQVASKTLTNQLAILTSDWEKNTNNHCDTNSTNLETLNKLLAVYGMNSAELNYGTQIIDSRAQNQIALKKDLEITEQDIHNLDANGSCFSRERISSQKNSLSKRDQIFCTDATIFLSELESKLATRSPLIDLVYSTKHSKQFVQFGDQHFQTKPDERDRYVHLTCQVIDYYTSELPSPN